MCSGSEPQALCTGSRHQSWWTWLRNCLHLCRPTLPLGILRASRSTLQMWRSLARGVRLWAWPIWWLLTCVLSTKTKTTARFPKCLTDCPRTGTREKVSHFIYLIELTFICLLALPPYIEVVANLFSANVMRKGQQRDTGRPLGATPGTKAGMASSKKSAQTTVRTNASGRTTPYRRWWMNEKLNAMICWRHLEH